MCVCARTHIFLCSFELSVCLNPSDFLTTWNSTLIPPPPPQWADIVNLCDVFWKWHSITQPKGPTAASDAADNQASVLLCILVGVPPRDVCGHVFAESTAQTRGECDSHCPVRRTMGERVEDRVQGWFCWSGMWTALFQPFIPHLQCADGSLGADEGKCFLWAGNFQDVTSFDKMLNAISWALLGHTMNATDSGRRSYYECNGFRSEFCFLFPFPRISPQECTYRTDYMWRYCFWPADTREIWPSRLEALSSPFTYQTSRINWAGKVTWCFTPNLTDKEEQLEGQWQRATLWQSSGTRDCQKSWNEPGANLSSSLFEGLRSTGFVPMRGVYTRVHSFSNILLPWPL